MPHAHPYLSAACWCCGGNPHPRLVARCWECRDHLERCNAQRSPLERFDAAMADFADTATRWGRREYGGHAA
jgi:hypothetical protein